MFKQTAVRSWNSMLIVGWSDIREQDFQADGSTSCLRFWLGVYGSADHGPTPPLCTPCSCRSIELLGHPGPFTADRNCTESGPLRRFASLVMSRYGLAGGRI